MHPTMCRGGNTNGQLANGGSTGSRLVPPGTSTSVYSQISVGQFAVCAISVQYSSLLCWGYNP